MLSHRYVLIAVLCPLLWSACPVSADSPAGKWIGKAKFNRRLRTAYLRFHKQDGVLAGQLDIPFAGPTTLRSQPLSNVVSARGQVSFRVALRDWDTLRFEGRLDGDLLKGTLNQGEDRSSFYFVRMADTDMMRLADYVGWYEFKSGRRGWMTWNPEGGLSYLDSGQMEAMTLFPTGKDEFFEWTGRPPFTIRVRFQRDGSGRVQGLTVAHDGSVQRSAKRTPSGPFSQKAVAFANGSVDLAGLLLTPQGEGPYPAVVVIHGSGYGTRDRARELLIAEHLLASGVAVLTYDKRGCGASSGDWTTASYEELATDALAAVHFLQQQPDIQADRIGLYGHSQGGVIVPIVAARSGAVAFVINESGSALPAIETELYYARNIYKNAGVRGANLEEAMAYSRLRLEATVDAGKWPEYLAARKRSEGKTWFAHSGVSPTLRDDPAVRAYGKQMAFDPGEAWRDVRVPALHLYGGADELVPVENSVERLRAIESRGDHPAWTYRVFPGASHGCHASPFFAKGFFELIEKWTRETTAQERDRASIRSD